MLSRQSVSAPTLAGKLVVAISSRALFDLTESHRVYTELGRRELSPLPDRARGRAARARARVRAREEAAAAQPAVEAVRRGDPAVAQQRRHRPARVQRDQALRPRHHARRVHEGRADVALRAGVRRAPVPVGRYRRRATRARGRLRGGDDLPERLPQRDRRAAHRVRRRRGAVFRRGRAHLPGERPRRVRAERARRGVDAAVGRAVQGIPRRAAPDPGRFSRGSRARSARRSSPRAARRRTSA